MKKRILSLLLTLCMLLSIIPAVDTTANAAETQSLTVNDGTATSNCSPVYSNYVDTVGAHTQFIQSQSTLTELQAGTLSSLTFYTQNRGENNYGAAVFTIKLMEVTDGPLSSSSNAFVDTTNATTVYEGGFNFDGEQVKLSLTENAFTYNGGDLLVDITVTTAGTYSNIFYYGVRDTGCSIRKYSQSGIGNENFLPKVTFEYVADPDARKLSSAVSGLPADLADKGGVTFSVNSSSGRRFAHSGDAVTVTAKEVPGYTCTGFSSGDVEITSGSFTMPDKPVTVTAAYTALPTYSLTGSVSTADYQSCGVTFSVDEKSVTEVYSGAEVAISVDTSGLGEFTYTYSGTYGETGTENTLEIDEDGTFTMPAGKVVVSVALTLLPEITVNDGTDTNVYAPIYGYNADVVGTQTQFVLSGSALVNLQDTTLSSLTFYSKSDKDYGGTFTVKLMEVTGVSFSSNSDFVDITNATTVYEGGISFTGNKAVLPLIEDAFTYNGGDLLVDITVTSKASYGTLNFYGKSGAGSYLARKGGSTSTSSYYSGDFAPKVTFGYVVDPDARKLSSAVSGLPTDLADKGGVTFSVNGSSGKRFAHSGDAVTVTAKEVPGYTCTSFSSEDVEITGGSFTMPDEPVRVTAAYTALPTYALTGSVSTEKYSTLSVAFTVGGNPVTEVYAGAEVAISVDTGELGEFAYTYSGTYGENGTENPLQIGEDGTFTMPAGKVVVSVALTLFSEITVNDGTISDQHFPIYGYYCDSTNTRTQFVQTASALDAVKGKKITSLTFYPTTDDTYNLGSAQFQVKMMCVNNASLSSSFLDTTSASTVYEGSLTVSGGKLVIELIAGGFTYSGDDLVIDITIPQSGNWKTIKFFGADGQGRYTTTSNDGVGTFVNFAPKMTVKYINTQYTVTADTCTNGSVSVGTTTSYAEGDTVTVTSMPDSGYMLDKVTVTKTDGGEDVTETVGYSAKTGTFTMPAYAVTVSAAFTQIKFNGASLRRRVLVSDKTKVVQDKTDIRLQFTFVLPTDAEINTTDSCFYWTKDGSDPTESSSSVKMTNYVENQDGTYTASLVVTGVPSAAFSTQIKAMLHVAFTVNEEAGSFDSTVNARSVNDGISYMKTLDENNTWCKYAKYLSKEISEYSI